MIEYVRVIRCDRCYAAFPGDKGMKNFTKHHKKKHKGMLSLFSQIHVQRHPSGELNFENMKVVNDEKLAK